jgi:hypothetical protein
LGAARLKSSAAGGLWRFSCRTGIWEILNTANGNCKKSCNIKEVYSGENLIGDDAGLAQTFNNYFSNIGTEILNSVEQCSNDPMSYIPDNPNIPEFVINNTGPCHVIDVVKAD